MTGYATIDGDGGRWELRAVNGRGLDIRLRVPPDPPGLERVLRSRITARVARGAVSASLRPSDPAEETEAFFDEDAFASVLDAVGRAADIASTRGIDVRAPSLAELLTLPGVLGGGVASSSAPALEICLHRFDGLLDAFDRDRLREGEALRTAIADHLRAIEGLLGRAGDHSGPAAVASADALRGALERLDIAGAKARADPARVAQELALLAIRSDAAEEVDRLRAHLTAARTLLDAIGPVGRRLDFLAQEIQREASTFAAKATFPPLAAVGLELKVVADRLREQAQNVE